MGGLWGGGRGGAGPATVQSRGRLASPGLLALKSRKLKSNGVGARVVCLVGPARDHLALFAGMKGWCGREDHRLLTGYESCIDEDFLRGGGVGERHSGMSVSLVGLVWVLREFGEIQKGCGGISIVWPINQLGFWPHNTP